MMIGQAFTGAPLEKRIALPTYPFQRSIHWIEPAQVSRVEPVDGGVDDLLYSIAWPRLPRVGPATLHTPDEVVDALEPQLDEVIAGTKINDFRDFFPRMDAICAALSFEAITSLGWQPQEGVRFSAESLSGELAIAKRHHRLFARMLEMLAEDGCLAQEGSDWRFVRDPETLGTKDQLASLRKEYPEFSAELSMIDRCAAPLSGSAARRGRSVTDIVSGRGCG